MNNKEKKLDKIIQEIATGQRCVYCGRKADCGHHLYHRSNKFLRWNLDNILPVCQEHHNQIHMGIIDDSFYKNNYLFELSKISLKQYLLEKGLTYDEFLELRIKELK